MMTSPMQSKNDSYDTSRHATAKRHRSLFHSGVMLLEDAERAPEYLRLTIDSDPDEPDQVEEKISDSEEDVVVLGEKRPTYQEITLEEDDEGEVNEKIVEKEKQEELPQKALEEILYDCTYCDKSFRVESLLKFHIKMHKSSNHLISSKETESSSSSMSSTAQDNDKILDNKPKKKRHSVNHNESRLKGNFKSSHKHKAHREKKKSHKYKKQEQSVTT